MKLVAKQTLDDSGIAPAEQGTGLKVWMLHDTAYSRDRAHMLLRHVAARLQSPGRMECAISSLNLLADAQRSKTLVREAQRADVIVVAADADWPLPRPCSSWISLWRLAKPGRPAVLAVVLDPGEWQTSEGRNGPFQLPEIARIGSVVFFAKGDGEPVATNEGELTRVLARRNGCATPTVLKAQPRQLPIVGGLAWGSGNETPSAW
jgi:hypothetical protein